MAASGRHALALETPATCGRLPPLAATCGHLRPLATTRVAASGCPALALETPCSQRPLAASCDHLRPLAATCSDSPLRPLAATRGHSSACKWLRMGARASRASGSNRSQVAAVWSGRLRPLAANRLAASGGNYMHLLQRPLAAAPAATCSQSSGCKWLQAAASGCMLVEIHGRAGILKKRFCWKGVSFFKVGYHRASRSPRILKIMWQTLTTHVFHSVGKILWRSINGGR